MAKRSNLARRGALFSLTWKCLQRLRDDKARTEAHNEKYPDRLRPQLEDSNGTVFKAVDKIEQALLAVMGYEAEEV